MPTNKLKIKLTKPPFIQTYRLNQYTMTEKGQVRAMGTATEWQWEIHSGYLSLAMRTPCRSGIGNIPSMETEIVPRLGLGLLRGNKFLVYCFFGPYFCLQGDQPMLMTLCAHISNKH